MTLDRGFIISNEILDYWGILLSEWIDCFEQFCSFSQTVPAQNKEETNVGILAGAAWKIGWVAFQEMLRRKSGSEKYSRIYDLYLCDSSGIVEDYIECKDIHVGPIINIIKSLKRACNQVENIVLNDNSPLVKRISVVFANFEFSNNQKRI